MPALISFSNIDTSRQFSWLTTCFQVTAAGTLGSALIQFFSHYRMPLAPSVSLHHISSLLPLTLTGADLHALCSDALYSALRRTINNLSTKNGEVDEAEEFKVEERDFQSAVKNLTPSVTSRDLAHYKSLKEKTQRWLPQKLGKGMTGEEGIF